jgi:hypothetical protein
MNALLNDQRNRYLAHYHAAIAETRSANEPFCTELLLEPGRLDDPEPAFRLYRIDIAIKAVDRTRLVDANLDPVDLDATLDGFGARIHLRAIAWNDIQLRVHGSDAPMGAIIEWSRRWMDLDERRSEGADGLQGVVRVVARPTPESDGSYVLSVDMGSAPVDALEELLAIVSRGAVHVDVTSTTNGRTGAQQRG